MGRHLRPLHINDNDGKKDHHWPPGRGIINWLEVYSALKEVKYSGVFMLEFYGYNVIKETIKEAVAYSRNLLKKGNTNTTLL